MDHVAQTHALLRGSPRTSNAIFSLSLAATVERLLHPYQVVLSRVDFWEASGTGLSARRCCHQLAKSTLETRRVTGKPSLLRLASDSRKLRRRCYRRRRRRRGDFSFRFRTRSLSRIPVARLAQKPVRSKRHLPCFSPIRVGIFRREQFI